MTEADYICFLAKNISLGLYQNGGFYVLPQFNVNKKSVYFPDLNYSTKFWSLISKCKAKNLGDKFPADAVAEIASKIKTNKSKRVGYEEITFDLLETEYGTVGSYFKNIMTQRLNNTQKDFERTFFLMKLKLKNKDEAEIGSINWHKRNAIVEYVIGKCKSQESFDLAKQSQIYLEKLGFGNKIILPPKIKNLTKQEEDILNLLQLNQGKIVTFDEIGDCLWGNEIDNKFSLEAMAKVVQNVRNKIKAVGINKEIIFTKRGKGYIFIS